MPDTKLPTKAFILAAGFGTRLRPHTDHCPKPLVKVGGQSLLDHILDRLKDAGIQDVVINTHYLGEQIQEQTQYRSDLSIHISHETELLDTGGGIKNKLGLFGDEPFFIINGDAYWEDNRGHDVLKELGQAWNSNEMDILIALQPVETMVLTKGVGDYDLDSNNLAQRSLDQTGAHMFTSIRINHPCIFENTPETPFSYLQLLDQAQNQKRLYGLINKGQWHHISTPKDLQRVNGGLEERKSA